MPRYWRDPDDDTVHLSRPGCPIDEFDVVVIPLKQWRELLRLWPFMWNDRGETNSAAAVQIDNILASVEAPE